MVKVPESHQTMISSMVVVTGAFVILVIVLKRYMWDKLSWILKKRKDKIANDLNSAEKSRIAAHKLFQMREKELLNSSMEAENILKNANESGKLIRQNIINETKKEIADFKKKAYEDIIAEKNRMIILAKQDIRNISQQVTEKVLNKELNQDLQQSIIDNYIYELGFKNEKR